MAKRLLEGIRVLDLTRAYAGPIGMRVLADMGAEVIKVEAIQRIDMPVRMISHAENTLDEQPYNRGGYFHRLNVNKKGITLDLNNPKGVEIFKELLKISDVVAENYSPRAMKNFGLDYEELKKIKPNIIMVSMSGYGQSGPEWNYAAYAPNMEAVAISSLTGFPDGMPGGSGTGYGDWCLGMAGATAALLALLYRQRTGKGQYIDVAGREVLLSHIGEAIMNYTMNGRVTPRMGNRHTSMAPHGVYRCKGDDSWVAIAVGSDAEWRSLVKAVGEPAWAKAEKFSTVLGRLKNQDELDRLIGEWTKDREHYEVMHLLQKAGVAAGAALNPKEVLLDPHLRARDFFVIIDQPLVGKRPQPRQMAAKFSKASGGKLGPAPRLGEDNSYVFGELLHMSKEEIAKLEEEKIIGTAPLGRAGGEKGLPLKAMQEQGVMTLDPNYLEEMSKAFGVEIGK